MFTGIVECTGTITNTRTVPGGRHLRIEVGSIADECRPGASICVSGVCLTVAEVTGQAVSFDVITETLERSTLGTKRTGDRVNLERSLRADDRLDGHFVQGHVDGTAKISRVDTASGQNIVWFIPEPQLVPFIIPKGSVAIDGVSLTIAAVEDRTFSVALIPTTLARTTLSTQMPGHRVNIETDIITRTVVHRLSEMSAAGGLNLDTLQKAGLA